MHFLNIYIINCCVVAMRIYLYVMAVVLEGKFRGLASHFHTSKLWQLLKCCTGGNIGGDNCLDSVVDFAWN